MEIRYTLQEEDVIQRMPRWSMSVFVLLIALMTFVGVFLLGHEFTMLGWIWLALTAAIAIGTYEVPALLARRTLRNNPSIHGEIIIVIDDEGMESTFATGKARFHWDAYTKYKETENLFLFYFSPSSCNYIPKRALSPDQVQELRSILRQRIQQPTKLS